MAIVVAVAFGCVTPLALAKTSHVYESAIREVPATGPAGPTEYPGPLQQATSLTAYAGNLYVAEALEKPVAGAVTRTDEWGSSGEFVSQLKQPEPGKPLDRGIAIGAATGETELYIGQEDSPVGVDVFSLGLCGGLECAGFQEKWGGTEVVPAHSFGGRITDVAVDHSVSPGDWASGDVFVDDAFSDAVDVFEPQAGGKEKYVTQVTGPSLTKHFGEPKSIAVSGFNGDLVVGEGFNVYLLRPEEEGSKKGKYTLVTGLASGRLKEVTALAVDDVNGEIYVASSTAIYEFGPEGSPRGVITGIPKEGAPDGAAGEPVEEPFSRSTTRPVSIAVDPVSEHVYVGVYSIELRRAVVDVFGPDVVIPDPVTEAPLNLKLEADDTGGHSWSIKPTGSVNPNEAGGVTCWFAWGASEPLESTEPCSNPVANGDSPVRVHTTLTGLGPDSTYLYRLEAKNGNGTNPGEASEDWAFTTPGPGLSSESASDVSSSSVTLEATIVPHDAPVNEHDFQMPAKSPTTYYFQYSTGALADCAESPSACTSVPLSPASIGAGSDAVEVEQHVRNLAPGTTYHYRVVGINEALPEAQPGVLDAFYGADQTFKTQARGGPEARPDRRVWELVSPVNKRGATIFPLRAEGLAQAGTEGDAFTYLTVNPTEAEPRGYGGFVQGFASRAADGGWSAVDIAMSHRGEVGSFVGVGHEYRFFSEDLKMAVAESFGPFSPPEGWHENGHHEYELVQEAFPEPTERTPYRRYDRTCGTEPKTCFEPLLNGEDVTSGEKFGGDEELPLGDAIFVGATPDENHVVISSTIPLTEAVAPHGGLYEWSASGTAANRLTPISLLPEDEGGEAAPSARLDDSENQGHFARRMVSDDGSRVFFSATSPGQAKEHIYMRDTNDGGTVRLDVAEGGSAVSQPQSVFQIASADGSRAFFTSIARLTKDAGATGADLYECDVINVEEAGKRKPKCILNDLTPVPRKGEPGAGEDARVQGGVLGASKDGNSVYFVANGVLARRATPGGNNLYVAQMTGGVWETTFITTLSADDFPDWGAGGFNNLVHMTSRVSPDGRWLAFMSDRSLTGYDNRDAKSGMPDEEVYLYDAATGKLVCASCDPSGARPIGVEYAKLTGGLAGGDEVWSSGQWLASNIPSWTAYRLATALYQSRYLSDSGRLFFNSSDALVAGDVNGNEDVYEFEPAGVGDCSSSSATFDVGANGCVGLISSGVASGESAFLDASGTGGDVFFLTKEKLVTQDVDTSLDVYDAHECTISSPCVSPPPPAQAACESAASCRAAPSPQPSLYGAPPSATFSGAGNVTPPASSGVPPSVKKTAAQVRAEKLKKALRVCEKKRRRLRAACERRARAVYGPVKASKAKARRSAKATGVRGGGRA